MNVAFNYNTWWNWADYPGQKVVFDGPNRIIYISEGVTELDVKIDIYSAWKEWVINSPESPEGSAYLKAFTAIGGDPITTSQNVGATYFLENGWRIQPFPAAGGSGYVLTVTGNIYTRETGENPFLFAQGVSVSLVRSNIVDLIRVEALGVNITNNDIQAIADAVTPATAAAVWQELEADHIGAGTFGRKVGRIATKIQDIALR